NVARRTVSTRTDVNIRPASGCGPTAGCADGCGRATADDPRRPRRPAVARELGGVAEADVRGAPGRGRGVGAAHARAPRRALARGPAGRLYEAASSEARGLLRARGVDETASAVGSGGIAVQLVHLRLAELAADAAR